MRTAETVGCDPVLLDPRENRCCDEHDANTNEFLGEHAARSVSAPWG